MSLDAGNVSREISAPMVVADFSAAGKAHVYQPWLNWEPSLINHHGSACCEIAR